jgi:hypothetical protein
MKSKLAAGVALLATVGVVGGASAQDTDYYYAGKVTPNLTLRVTPKRDRTRPFEFTASGRLQPKRAGASACRGWVTIRFRKRGHTIARGVARVQPDCRYSRLFRLRVGGRHIEVRAHFRGNSRLRPRSAGPQFVRAG